VGDRPDASGAQALSALAHILFAALLFAALTLPTLQPFGEDDRWLGIGTVMLTVGLATWLPLTLMLPFIVAAWGLPFLAWELSAEPGTPSQTPFSLEAAAQLAGLFFLGWGASVLYRSVIRSYAAATLGARAAATRQAESSPPLPGWSIPLVDASPKPRTARRLSAQTLPTRDATVLLQQLALLRFELRETASHLRAN
jgi:hypothetical protein